MYAVQVTEVDPPAGVEPIEWLLLTTDSITSVEDVWQRVQWYRCRWRSACFFNKLKQYRRAATRYQKTAINFLGFVFVASLRMWLA
jgi:transposase